MYCIKCGNEIENGVSFCPNCGTNQNAPLKQAPRITLSKKVWIIPVTIVVAAVLIVVCISLFGSQNGYRNCEDLAMAAAEALIEGDAEKLIGCLPDFVVKDKASYYGLSEEYPVKELRKLLIKAISKQAAGKKEIEVKILDCYMEEEVSVSEIDWTYYGLPAYETDQIQKVVYMNVQVSSEDYSATLQVACVKMDDRWYAFDFG